MNKKIQQSQIKLQEAKLERERKKVKYDSNAVILEGQRNVIIVLEERSDEALKDLMESDRAVGEFQTQLQNAINEEHALKIESEKPKEQ